MSPLPSEGNLKFLWAYCSSLFVFRLFCRMQQSMASRGWSPVLITPLFSVHLKARSQRIPCHLIESGRPERHYEGLDVETTRESLQRLSPIADLQRFQASVLSTLEGLTSHKLPSAVAVFNGMDAGSRAMLSFAHHLGIPTLVLELGNIDSKLLADPAGFNAASILAKNPELLDSWQVSEEEFSAWLARFKTQRLVVNRLPQAKISRSLNPYYALDRLAARILGIPQPLVVPVGKKIASKIQVHRIPSIPELRPASPYVFLPLQVTADMNLLAMSDLGNLAAVEIAARRARELVCDLVVKMHPAETDRAVVQEIERVCAERGHLLTSLNTTELILGATEIVTINSTAGLEALLYGKKVTTLGRCMYREFSASRARAYVLRYLIDFDPFGSAPMSLAAFDRMLERLEIGANHPHLSSVSPSHSP